jgi:outer membrane protein TolC
VRIVRWGITALAVLALPPGCARLEATEAEGEAIMEEGNLAVESFRSDLVQPTKAPPREDRPSPVEVPAVLTLADALRIATEHNRDYQSRREQFFLTALGLGLTRRDFHQMVFTGNLSNNLSDGRDVELAETTALALTGTRAVLPTGGTFSISANLAEDHPASNGSIAGTVVFSQPLLRGAGKEVAWEPLTAAERGLVYEARGFELYRQDFTVSIIQQYASLVSQKRGVQNAQNRVTGNEYSERQAKALYRLQMGTQTDVFRAEREHRDAQNALLDAQQGFQLALDSFKITLGLPLSAQFDVVDEIPVPPEEDFTVEGAIGAALANRLDLATARQQLEDAERQVRIARNALLPDLSFDASYTRGASDDAPDIESWAFGLSLEIPLDRKGERNALKSAMIGADQSRRGLQQTEDSVILSVRDALRRLQQTRLQMRNDRDNIRTIERLLLKADLENRAGRGSNRDVVEATNDLTDAKNSLNERFVSYLIDTLTLQREMGLLFVDREGQVIR